MPSPPFLAAVWTIVWFRSATWRVFLAGALCGAVLMAATGAVFVWWKGSHPERSAQDDFLYDACLAEKNGNTAAWTA
jgi:hypothetical protein